MSSVSLSKLAPATYKAKISLKEHEINDAEKKALRRIGAQKHLKGFRKGKAPEHLIRSRFPLEIEKESSMEMIQFAFDEIKNQLESAIHKIISIDRPSKKRLEVTFDCKPYVKFCKFTEVILYEDKIDISDDRIDLEIKGYQLKIALGGDKKEKIGPPYEEGNLIVISFETLIDEVPNSELEQKDVSVVLGNNPKNKMLDEYVLKKQPPLKTEFVLKGKVHEEVSSQSFTQIVFLHSAYELEYPPIDDNFPKLATGRLDNMNEFREHLRVEIRKIEETMISQQQASYALEKIVEKSEIIVSQNFLDDNFHRYRQQAHNEKEWSEKELDHHRKKFEKMAYYYIVKEELTKLIFGDQKSQEPSTLSEFEIGQMLLTFLRTQGAYRKGSPKSAQEILKERFP